jgi:hypothetical protein
MDMDYRPEIHELIQDQYLTSPFPQANNNTNGNNNNNGVNNMISNHASTQATTQTTTQTNTQTTAAKKRKANTQAHDKENGDSPRKTAPPVWKPENG